MRVDAARTQYLDEGMQKWIYVTANRNYWRVPRWYGIEDLVSDGFACYYKCLAHYGRLARKRQPRKDDRRHFMSLVRTTFLRHITNLANERTATPERPVCDMHRADETAETWLERNGPISGAVADFSVIFERAPREIRTLLRAFADDAAEGIAYARKRLEKTGLLQRETTNERLCRLAEANPKTVDMVEFVRQFVRTQPA